MTIIGPPVTDAGGVAAGTSIPGCYGAKLLRRSRQVNPKSKLLLGPRSKSSLLLALELELRGELLLRLRRHRRVVAEFHRVGALPAGDGAQSRLVTRHFR